MDEDAKNPEAAAGACGTVAHNGWAIIEWMTEHSATTINRAQVGHDGKTPFRRLLGKEAVQPLVEFGEQVLAKPLRQKKTSKKVSLATRWLHGTWVGIADRSNENLVVLPEGGASDQGSYRCSPAGAREMEP